MVIPPKDAVVKVMAACQAGLHNMNAASTIA